MLAFGDASAEVVVRLDQSGGVSPESLEADVNSDTSPRPQSVADLGYPTTARYLIQERLAPEDIAFLGEDSARVRLHNFMVLEYPLPTDIVKLIRRWHEGSDDHAIFPETKLAAMEAAGYVLSEGVPGDAVLGYAYPNEDSDGDGLVNGFELFVGTNRDAANSDCDGGAGWAGVPAGGTPGQRSKIPIKPGADQPQRDGNRAGIRLHQPVGGAKLPRGVQRVSLGAGQVVELKPGFRVAVGGRLSVRIGTN
jgi:hypothetical protein